QGRVVDTHAPEAPTRFAKQLSQLFKGACCLHISRERALALARRVARDSMPPLRLAIMEVLAQKGPSTRGSTVRQVLDKPRTTIERQLQSLNMLGLVSAEEKPGAQYPVWEY